MDERVVLRNGKKYEFDYEGELFSYEISKCIGRGGNSIVYEVRCNDYEIGRLKEFYPADMAIKRNEQECLITEDTDFELYEKRKELFERVREKRAELLEISHDIASTMPEFYQLIRGRNTSYFFQSYTNGRCYSDIRGESLEHIIKTSIGLVKALKCYHDVGYVHLDIKPENMLVINDGKNVKVQLFDYETVTAISDLKRGKINTLPYTEQYSAPEHIKREYDKIDIMSDVFSAGIVVFEKVMGRFPDKKNRELAHNTCYEYDINSPLFEGIPLIIQKSLDNLFEHTIRVSEKLRYNNDEELIAMLEELLSFTQKKNGIVKKDNYYSTVTEFFGRTDELIDLDDALSEKNLILLYGMGGIGKSELIRKYLTENEDQYTKIVYIEETGNSIREAINDDENVKIEGLQRIEGLSADDYFDNKIAVIRQECENAINEKKSIIVVFDNTEFFAEFAYLNKIRNAGCKVVVISRDPWEGVPFEKKIEINRISNKNDEIALFTLHMDSLGIDEKEKEAIEKIIDHYDGHPLLLELIAKAMNSSGKLPSEMIREINEKGIGASGEEEIRYIENGLIKQECIENIAYNLFDSCDLGAEEIGALQFMSLLTAEGIEKKYARKIIGDLRAVNLLIGKGFIRSRSGVLSIHPIIKEMVGKRYTPNKDDLKKYQDYVYDNLSCSEKYRVLTHKELSLYTCIGHSIDNIIGIDDADFYASMGNAYQRIGQGEKANVYFLKSLNLLKDKYGEDDENVAMAYMRYGRVLGVNGEYDKSRIYLEKSAAHYKSLLIGGAVVSGALLPFAPIVGGIIGGALLNKSIIGKAFSPNTYGNNVNSTCDTENELSYDKKLNAAKTYNQLARWYCDQGDCENALLYCKKAYDIALEKSKTYERAKSKLYYFADTMASIQFENAEYNEALNYYLEAMTLKKELYSEENIYFMHSYLGIAKCKYMVGLYQDALEWVLKAMTLAEKMKGVDSIDTAKVYHVVAKIYQELGADRETTMYYDQAKKVEEKLLGSNNSFTLLVTVDFLYYKIIKHEERLSKREYEALVSRILAKTRPRTATFQSMYKEMNLIAEKFGFKKIKEFDVV